MLKIRILTALVLLLLVLFALFIFSATLWAVFCALILTVALWEYARMIAMRRAHSLIYLAVSLMAVWGLQSMSWQNTTAFSCVVLVFWLAVVPCCLYLRYVFSQIWLQWLVGWIIFIPASLAMLQWREQSPVLLLVLMALVWVADIAAYFVGQYCGRHKLAPRISPGKSLEGLCGALVAGVLYMSAVLYFGWVSVPLGAFEMGVLGFGLTLVSVAGDLLESWLKRCASIKDSGSLLPGHGGVYDRIDSLVAVLAVSHALYTLTYSPP